MKRRRAFHAIFSNYPPEVDRQPPMSATPTEDQIQDAHSTEASAETAAAEQAFEGEDLSIPEDVPTADDPTSRAASRSLDDAGFTLDEFAALLSKYDYNFKPGDIVNGTVFALETKGAMIDIGAKTAAFMPLQEVSINRVEGATCSSPVRSVSSSS